MILLSVICFPPPIPLKITSGNNTVTVVIDLLLSSGI